MVYPQFAIDSSEIRDTAPSSPPGAGPAAPAAPPARGFRFFDLPAELRNQIYDYAGFEDARRELDFVSLRSPGEQDGPALLRANKQLAQEAGAHYFAHGHFDIATSMRDPKPLLDWLKAIGPVNRHRLASNANVTIRLVHYSQRFDHNWNMGVFWSVITGAYRWPEQSSLPVGSRCPLLAMDLHTARATRPSRSTDTSARRGPTRPSSRRTPTTTPVGLLWGDSRQVHLPALADFMTSVRSTIMTAEVEAY